MNEATTPLQDLSAPGDLLDRDLTHDYESLLAFVNKPSRYIGGEFNTTRRNEAFRKQAISLCLCFPDLYETGFANMGVEILYRVVNRRTDAFAERAYALDDDFAKLLRERNWPMFSLENRLPLNKFDIVGFSLPYELCYNNVLEMLDLAQIPVRQANRTIDHPIIVGGGPCVVNPEPMADFFDAFVIGDGEEIIGEMIETVKEFKRTGSRDKQELLLELGKIVGLYVPSLYEVKYNEDNTVASVTPKFPGIAAKVAYRQTVLSKTEGDQLSFPTSPIVPFVQTVHDRLNVEIQRGCPWRCRFCQAGFTYHTYRERKKDELVQIIEQGLRNTGYDAVTLAGLSAADHREIVPLLQALAEKFTPQRISIGLPSTRADRFTLALAEILQTVRRQSLTFAPEAGSERLRRVIRKELQETEIRETLRLTSKHGWKNVKLYFMYGLPTETQEDLDGIVQLIRHSRKENPGLAITLTLSPFVPKPHTPYQWHQQDRYETHMEKLSYLRKNLPAQIRAHGLEQIVLEGVLSRGDRRCSALLEETWRTGSKFDEWGERFNYANWVRGYEKTGINPEFFCYRERTEKEVLPWEHLSGGPDKKALWLDYQTSLRQSTEPLPETPHLKIRPEVPALSPESLRHVEFYQQKSVQRLRFKLARTGSVRFTSHLEQIEMVRRTLRRAGFPLSYTSGFHPQMKCSFGPAISVGYESECEYFDIDFATRVETEDCRKAFEEKLPEGFTLARVARIPLFFPSLEALLNRVEYEVVIPGFLLADGEPDLEAFLNQPDLAIEKIKKGKRNEKIKTLLPLKPLLVKMEWVSGRDYPDARTKALRMILKFGPGKNAKPEKIAGLFLKLGEDDTRRLLVKRKAFHIEKQDGTLVEP